MCSFGDVDAFIDNIADLVVFDASGDVGFVVVRNDDVWSLGDVDASTDNVADLVVIDASGDVGFVVVRNEDVWSFGDVDALEDSVLDLLVTARGDVGFVDRNDDEPLLEVLLDNVATTLTA